MSGFGAAPVCPICEEGIDRGYKRWPVYLPLGFGAGRFKGLSGPFRMHDGCERKLARRRARRGLVDPSERDRVKALAWRRLSQAERDRLPHHQRVIYLDAVERDDRLGASKVRRRVAARRRRGADAGRREAVPA